MSQTRLERAERSPSRFAGVTRVGLRVVVVAGIAGAAWALSATAASAAADPHSASVTTDTPGAPLTSMVTGTLHSLLGTDAPATRTSGTGQASAGDVLQPVGNVVKPLLTSGDGLLSQVLAPVHTVVSPHGDTGEPLGAGRSKSTAGPRHTAVRTPGASTRDTIQVAADARDRPDGTDFIGETGAGSTDLVRTVTNLVAPLGLDDVLQSTLDELQPVVDVVDPLTAPLDQLLGTVDGVSTPIFDALDAVTKPVTGIDAPPTVAFATPAAAPVGMLAPKPLLAPVPETTVAAAPVRVDDGTPAKRAIVRHGTRGAPARWSSPLGLDRHHIPASPVPLPALPAPALGGISTMGSGSHEDNGGVAVLSAPIVRGVGIQLRKSRAIGFAVRRLIVENPTVSPD
ncbi:MAG TPA: hypothetical protein VGF84_01760 [Micromonosporaceae bacterium]